jgi:hypothetical protein
MVDAPELDWGSSDLASDLFSEDQTEVKCNHCGTELPVHVQRTSIGCEVTLDDYQDTVVEADCPIDTSPDDDGYDQDVPASPYEHFIDAYHHLGHVLAQVNNQGQEIHIQTSSLAIVNRMIFTQGIAAMEAYLGDTLKNGVLGSSAATRAMLVGDKVLSKMAISLTDIAANPMIVRDTVAKYLSDLIYHKLSPIGELYKIAFGISIFPSKDTADKLFAAVNLRHDCVHRNGKDKAGNELTGITREYVDGILDTALSMVIHIEGGLGRDRSRDWRTGY